MVSILELNGEIDARPGFWIFLNVLAVCSFYGNCTFNANCIKEENFNVCWKPDEEGFLHISY